MKHPRVPFSTIKAATEGNAEAMSQIASHYERYILKLSTKQCKDQYGNKYVYVDDDMKRQLEAKLIISISKFKIY